MASAPLTLDLSRLPAPKVVQELDFETILDARLEDLKARLPGFDALLESDPAVKLAQTDAWRELLLRADINDSARSVMLAFASGSDLDHLAALFEVERRVIVPATDTEPAVLESDSELRARIQIAPETLPHAGVTGGFYRAKALAADASLKDVRAISRGGGHVDVVLLSREGDGTVAHELVAAISGIFTAEDATQLTDIVSVRAAAIVPYSAQIHLQLAGGPDPALVAQEAEAAIRAHAARRHAIGKPVFAQQLAAAASVGGVEHAIVATGDIVPGDSGAAWLAGLTVTTELLQ